MPGGTFAGQRSGLAHALQIHSRARASPAQVLIAPYHMSWWRRVFGGNSEHIRPKRIDSLTEALALERQGDFDAALTSYRLALRDQPNDPRILQNMAIAFSKTGQLDDAVRSYRRALELDPQLSGAHYGLAYLLLKRGDLGGAQRHLHAFLSNPPKSAEADRWVRHAQQTLDQIASSHGAPDPARELE
jgi:tetratricopeptide (TPR) repeat protein